ncbi:hypothetical protein DBR42_13075 [Pelomonas sp. HMWF004]|nr:hypothetical protein DBR42_13075 [Pelomonas sp. HMWF004]
MSLFSFLFRCCLFIAGLVFLADAGLPTRTEQLQVDRHTSQTKRDNRSAASSDTSYTLHLVGGSVRNCSVGYALYTRLNDGDRIEVRSSRVFKQCVRISQGEDIVEDDKYWKLIRLIIGGLMLATAFGWLRGRGDEDDRSGISVRLG